MLLDDDDCNELFHNWEIAKSNWEIAKFNWNIFY